MKARTAIDAIDLFDLDASYAESPVVEPSNVMAGWQSIGFCGRCVQPGEAMQPGGRFPRHTETRTPLCGQQAPTAEALEEMPPW